MDILRYDKFAWYYSLGHIINGIDYVKASLDRSDISVCCQVVDDSQLTFRVRVETGILVLALMRIVIILQMTDMSYFKNIVLL